MKLDDLQHVVVLFHIFELQLQPLELVVFQLCHPMFLNFLLLFDDKFFERLVTGLDTVNRILLSINLSLPVALHSPDLPFMLSQLLIQCLKLVIKLLLLFLDLADMLLQRRSLVV